MSLDNATGLTALKGPLTWTSERRMVLVNNRQFRIKGINWFGFGKCTEVWRGKNNTGDKTP
jgi:hypothetical protein